MRTKGRRVRVSPTLRVQRAPGGAEQPSRRAAMCAHGSGDGGPRTALTRMGLPNILIMLRTCGARADTREAAAETRPRAVASLGAGSCTLVKGTRGAHLDGILRIVLGPKLDEPEAHVLLRQLVLRDVHIHDRPTLEHHMEATW